MAKSPVFDTSVFPPFAQQIERQIATTLFPSIVFYELTATSIDESTLKKYETWRRTLGKIDRVLTPSGNDWWETAKSIRRLYLKKSFPVSKLRTLQNDALIARLAVKNDAFVVTMDVDDFEIIKREMPRLDVVPADYFFS
ncbi:MAG: type II toxin-antitoxin system VapC family toxin [Acidobacteria bacterium]|nr:type II toxin-antitoxin system VapC family toxin [Acidobacteriota bacterium]